MAKQNGKNEIQEQTPTKHTPRKYSPKRQSINRSPVNTRSGKLSISSPIVSSTQDPLVTPKKENLNKSLSPAVALRRSPRINCLHSNVSLSPISLEKNELENEQEMVEQNPSSVECDETKIEDVAMEVKNAVTEEIKNVKEEIEVGQVMYLDQNRRIMMQSDKIQADPDASDSGIDNDNNGQLAENKNKQKTYEHDGSESDEIPPNQLAAWNSENSFALSEKDDSHGIQTPDTNSSLETSLTKEDLLKGVEKIDELCRPSSPSLTTCSSPGVSTSALRSDRKLLEMECNEVGSSNKTDEASRSPSTSSTSSSVFGVSASTPKSAKTKTLDMECNEVGSSNKTDESSSTPSPSPTSSSGIIMSTSVSRSGKRKLSDMEHQDKLIEAGPSNKKISKSLVHLKNQKDNNGNQSNVASSKINILSNTLVPLDDLSACDEPINTEYSTPGPSRNLKKDGNNRVSTKLKTNWPIEDIEYLMQRVANVLPENDKMEFSLRLNKIIWEDIAFKEYTPNECKKIFKKVNEKVRHHRILKEIVKDCRNFLKVANIQNIRSMDKPRGPGSLFFYFRQQMWSRCKRHHPNKSFIAINRMISVMYRKLSDEKKEMLRKKRQKDLKIYYKELMEYYKDNPNTVPFYKPDKVAKAIIANDPPPELPPKPYQLYCSKRVEKASDGDSSDYRKEWTELSLDDKVEYLEEVKQLYEEYKEKLENYCRKYPLYKPKHLKYPVLNKEELKLLEIYNKPKKPPRSSFLVFYEIMSKEEPLCSLQGQERLSVLRDQWVTFSDNQREVYRIRKDQLWEKYAEEIEEYVKKFPLYKRHYIRKDALKENKKILNKVLESKHDGVRKRKLKDKVEQEPQIPPSNAFKYFQCLDEDNNKQAWDALTKKEKQYYENKVVQLKKKYVIELENYLKGLSEVELEEYCRTHI